MDLARPKSSRPFSTSGQLELCLLYGSRPRQPVPGHPLIVGIALERHRDHFKPTSPDEEWLAIVGSRGWVAVTHDSRIRYKPNELEAVVRHRVRLLVVVGKAPFPELAQNFVSTIPKINRFLAQHDPPLIAKIHRPTPADLKRKAEAGGSVSLWYP